jgi:hypothetical protein
MPGSQTVSFWGGFELDLCLLYTLQYRPVRSLPYHMHHRRVSRTSLLLVTSDHLHCPWPHSIRMNLDTAVPVPNGVISTDVVLTSPGTTNEIPLDPKFYLGSIMRVLPNRGNRE